MSSLLSLQNDAQRQIYTQNIYIQKRDTENTTCWQPFVFELKNKENLKGSITKPDTHLFLLILRASFQNQLYPCHLQSSSGIPVETKESHMVEQHAAINCYKDRGLTFYN